MDYGIFYGNILNFLLINLHLKIKVVTTSGYKWLHISWLDIHLKIKVVTTPTST